jgi:phage terminase small subunit
VKQRGRKSGEAKTMLSLVNIDQYKPEAPEHLTEEQREVWSDIVESMRPGSFVPSTFPLLELYCVHVCRARFIEAQLRQTDIEKELKSYKTWAAMARNESAVLCSPATKLRLLPKANTRLDRQETTASGQPWNIRRPRPWEDDDDKPAA